MEDNNNFFQKNYSDFLIESQAYYGKTEMSYESAASKYAEYYHNEKLKLDQEKVSNRFFHVVFQYLDGKSSGIAEVDIVTDNNEMFSAKELKDTYKSLGKIIITNWKELTEKEYKEFYSGM